MASSAPVTWVAPVRRVERGALAEGDAVAGVQVAEVVGGGGGGDAGEDAGGGLENGDVEALLAEDGGGFEADVAAADDEGAGAAREGGGEGVGVGEGAHQQDAGEVAADLGGEAAGGAAGGQREEVVGQRAAVGEGQGAGGGVDGGGGGAEEEGDLLGLEEGGGPEEQAFERHLALEVALGERRALVGEVRLGADEGQRAGVSEGAQAGDQRGAGLACAHHDDPRRLRIHAAPFALASLPRPSICRGSVPATGKRGRAMTIALGDRLPEATFLEKGPEGIGPVPSAELFGGRRVVLFGLPGAFTGMCSSRHVPSFIRVADAIRAKGVDEIVCVSVNDPHVMLAWSESSGAGAAGIRMLADADGAFARAMGLTFDNPGARALRALEALCADGRGRGGEGVEHRDQPHRLRAFGRRDHARGDPGGEGLDSGSGQARRGVGWRRSP